MADIFSQQDAKQLFENKFILFMGDSSEYLCEFNYIFSM